MQRFAWLSLILGAAACGSVKNGDLPDAPKPGSDAPIAGADAPPDHGTVSVHVLDPRGTGADAIGIQVVFTDTDGSQVVVDTDGSGIASGDVHGGASVTTVAVVSTGFDMETVNGVEPNDAITIGLVTANTASETPIQVTAPAFPSTATIDYIAWGPCGNSAVSQATGGAAPAAMQVPLEASCAQSPGLIQIEALDTTTDTIVGWLEQPNTSLVPGSSVTASGTYESPVQTTAAYVNLGNATTVNFGRLAPDGFGFEAFDPETPNASGSASAVAAGPALPSPATIVAESVLNGPSGGQTIREVLSGNATTYGMDGSQRLLPWLGTPTADLATATITTPVDATMTSGDAPDLFATKIAYRRAGVDGGTATSYEWFVYQATPGDVTLPTLPSSVGTVEPEAGDVLINLQSTSVDLDTVNGFAAARLVPDTIIPQTNLATHPNTGTKLVRFSIGQISR